jgi:hypothetical protein
MENCNHKIKILQENVIHVQISQEKQIILSQEKQIILSQEKQIKLSQEKQIKILQENICQNLSNNIKKISGLSDDENEIKDIIKRLSGLSDISVNSDDSFIKYVESEYDTDQEIS